MWTFTFSLKVAQQPVLNHFQVQLAHAADERLAGFRVLLGAKRGVLLAEHVERVASFLRSSVLSGSIAIEMTVSGNSIDASRIGSRVSHSVSPVIESRRPMTPTMSPARADSSCSSFFDAWMRQSWATFSFLSRVD